MALEFFDFSNGRGQRASSFQFERREGSSLRPLGLLHPIWGGTLTHTAGRSVMRTLTFEVGEAESAEVNFVSERIYVSMVVDGEAKPLGRFRFADATQQDFADEDSGNVRSLTACQLSDYMSIVDTELETSFTSVLEPARGAIERLLSDIDVEMLIEDSGQLISNSWMAGTSRKAVLEAIAELGGYLAPWFDHEGVLQIRRQFDPTAGVADFDFDAQQNVFADSVTRSDSTIYAPNRIVVVSNGGNTYGGSSSEKNPVDPIDPGPMMAFCDVPSTAPHSVMNLGFVRPDILEVQATSVAQCQAVADLMCLTQTVAEEVDLSTALDPRHDGWNTVDFQEKRWLEIGWSMQLLAGGEMRHSLQRSYPPSPEVLSGVVDQILAGGI
jgi:hypothetical protein